MIKRTINLLITLALYELAKYVTEQLIIILTANDEVDQSAKDFHINFEHRHMNDHIHLNNIRAEVSE